MGFAALYPSCVLTRIQRWSDGIFTAFIFFVGWVEQRETHRLCCARWFSGDVSFGLVRAIARIDLGGGFRPRTTCYFLAPPKKVTKERRPDCRALRVPCASRPNRRSPTRRPGAKARTRPPWRAPCGLLPIRAAMLGAADGGKAESQIKTAPFPVGCAPRTVSFGWHGIGAQCAPYIVMCARSAHTLGAMPQASRLCLSNPSVSPSNAARGGIARRGRAMDGAHSSVGTRTCRRKNPPRASSAGHRDSGETSGRPFLSLVSFGRAKESNTSYGGGTPTQYNRA
jgi:hypothetical protein